MQLSIIIVSYHVRDFLEQCLYSVCGAVKGMDAEVFVVDNASPDDSVAHLSPLFPSVHFIANTENLGFAKANNLAIEKCSGEFVLFLNPDTLVPESSLQKCISFLQSHPDTGAMGVRMLDGHGRFLAESKRAFPSPWVSFCKLAGLSRIFSHSSFFNRYALGHLDEHQDHEVEILAGAFMMVRRNILQDLHGFDERFFLYGEDIDLSYRIRQAGWKNRYFSGVSIIHFKGESSTGATLLRVKYFYQAMLVFVQKYYRGGTGIFYSFFLKSAIAFRALISAIKRLVQNALPQSNDQNQRVLVIAGNESYASILPLTTGFHLLGCISPRKDTGDNQGFFQQIAEIHKQHRADAILFCIGELTLGEAIEAAEMLRKKNTRFLFHMPQGQSIIGGR